MKQAALDELVYRTLFPRPKPSDPRSFQALLTQYLVPEVRLETQAFYGSLSTQEAKYPGLDYSHGPHRLRLSRFAWHRRLFRAFDALGLTRSEIAGLTRWEGTRWARERFEREQSVQVRDTTAEEVAVWVEPELRTTRRAVASSPSGRATEQSALTGRLIVDDHGIPSGRILHPNGYFVHPPPRMAIMATSRTLPLPLPSDLYDSSEDEEDGEIQSVGLELNERLRAAAAQRAAGDISTVMDPEWEQWLKDAAEAGAGGSGSGSGSSMIDPPAARAVHPRVVQVARETPRERERPVARDSSTDTPPAAMRPPTTATLRRQDRRSLSMGGPDPAITEMHLRTLLDRGALVERGVTGEVHRRTLSGGQSHGAGTSAARAVERESQIRREQQRIITT